MSGIKDGYLFLATKIITGLVGVISIGIQTRYISASVIGQYSLITGVTSVCITLIIGWLASSALRYYHQYSISGKTTFFSTVNIDWIALTTIAVLVVTILAFAIKSIPIKEHLSLVILLVINASAFQVYEKLLRASKHNILYCILLLIQSGVNLLTLIVINTVFGLQIESLFWANIITSFMFVVVSAIAIGGIKETDIYSFDWNLNKKFFDYGLPMIGVWGISWLLNYSDRYIINYFLSSTDVGLYDIAYRFSESSIGLIIAAFNLAFFPEMIRCWNNEGEKAIEGLLTSIFRVLFLISLPAVIGLAVLSGSIYGTILDSSYSDAAIVITISCVGFVFMGINNCLYKLWELEEKTTNVLYLTLVAVTINIVTNFLFIPLFGYIAAAWTTVISYVCVTVIAILLLQKRFRIVLNTTALFKEGIAASIMGCFVYFVRQYIDSVLRLLVVIVLAAALYFLVLIILKDINKKDISTILSRQ